jgi:hypothetical protein
MKIRPWEPSCSLRADRRTDRETHDEAISRFSQFFEAPKMASTSGVLKYKTVLFFKANVNVRFTDISYSGFTIISD